MFRRHQISSICHAQLNISSANSDKNLIVYFVYFVDFFSSSWVLLACNCNGYSTRCFFDQSLFDATGHGGHCLDCSSNRDGPNCERCRDNFYRREDDYCVPCNCDETGNFSLLRLSILYSCQLSMPL